MRIPVKKLKNGFSIPVYGFGTWEIGGGSKRDPNYDEKKAILAIQQAFESGISHFDTAEAYAEGYAEEILSKALQSVDRKKLFFTSKVLPQNLGYKNLIHACEQSLKRLNTDYLDLYLIHRPNPVIDLSETMKALDSLVDDGKVKYIGVSNFTNQNLQKAQQMTRNKIVVNQVHYNLIHREIEDFNLLEYCHENDVMMVAYTPVQKGLLAGDQFDLLNSMTKKYHKTAVQIAIAWLLSQKNVVTIAKTMDSKHLIENLGSVGWQMEKDDVELLRNSFPEQIQQSKSYLSDVRNNY